VTTHDLINAVFEGCGAIFLCLNVRRLLKDKSVKGVSLLTTSHNEKLRAEKSAQAACSHGDIGYDAWNDQVKCYACGLRVCT